jgi:hypothetical protein
MLNARNAVPKLIAIAGGVMLLSACSSASVFNRDRPDEFAVQRQAPLVVPPDFELAPPAPGAPRPTDGTAAQQALDALFGGPSARSAVEANTLRQAGESEIGIRSSVGDPGTFTVDKGTATRTILAAPEGDGQDASAAIPS